MYYAIKYISIFGLVTFLVSCKHSTSKKIHKQIPSEFFAHWVQEDCFDNFQLLDSTDYHIEHTYQIVFGKLTEIDLQENLFDSVELSCEDLESYFLRMANYRNLTLTLEDSTRLLYLNDEDVIK